MALQSRVMTEFFYAGNSGKTELDDSLNPDMLMAANPAYYGPKFQAIADLRKLDDGTLHKGNEFRRVASFVNIPLFRGAVNLFNPDFMKDKKKFYEFLDRHLEYCTYDRRNRGMMTAGDRAKLPLSVLGLDYPGGPETAEGWDPVDVEPMDAVVVKAEDEAVKEAQG